MVRNRIIRQLIWIALVLMLPMLLVSPVSLQADQAQYFYDELGRLAAVSGSTGKTAIYTYDAVGNLLSIVTNTPPGSGIGIYLAAPNSGAVGTQVAIEGYGYDTTPASNIVKFHDTTATVLSATAYTIVTTVPAGATTGPITVQNANGVATSPQDFTVTTVAPTVTAIAPTAVAQGSSRGLTITGTNLLNATSVQFTQSGLTATILSGVTATSLPINLTVAPTVPVNAYSFTVTTIGGSVSNGTVTVSVIAPVPSANIAVPLSIFIQGPPVAPSGPTSAVAPPVSFSMP